uniref:Uncharacterized protein n=1 Tax=Peronospora matthiolae TaxID=2874970 RepID=A0AAV1TI83_9STRA
MSNPFHRLRKSRSLGSRDDVEIKERRSSIFRRHGRCSTGDEVVEFMRPRDTIVTRVSECSESPIENRRRHRRNLMSDEPPQCNGAPMEPSPVPPQVAERPYPRREQWVDRPSYPRKGQWVERPHPSREQQWGGRHFPREHPCVGRFYPREYQMVGGRIYPREYMPMGGPMYARERQCSGGRFYPREQCRLVY